MIFRVFQGISITSCDARFTASLITHRYCHWKFPSGRCTKNQLHVFAEVSRRMLLAEN